MIETKIMHVTGTRPEPVELLAAFSPLSPTLALDPQRDGPWANAQRCLTAPRDPRTTHILILNDDVLPTPGVIQNVQAVARYGRPSIVSLYSYHQHLNWTRANNANWIESFVYMWGCAQLIPVDTIASFLAFNEKYVREDWNVDDTRWVLFAIARGQPNYIFAPSLVDHRADWESVHMPGKVHTKTEWLSSGPIQIRDETMRFKEQDGATYLRTRAHRFKNGVIPAPNSWRHE